MLRVVGPNPAMDRLEVLATFSPGDVNRSIEVVSRPGGKAFVVARGIRRLGGTVAAYGFLGGATGDALRAECRTLGIVDRHVQIAGETRITPVLVERGTGRSTVINEPGPTVTPAEAEALLARLAEDVEPGDLVATNGSLPPGLPVGYHGAVMAAVTGRGGRAVIDSSGPALVAALRDGAGGSPPWLLKVNRAEFNVLFDALFRSANGDGMVNGAGTAPGRETAPADRTAPADDPALLAAMARLVHGSFADQVIVTLGSAGCAYSDGSVTLVARPPAIKAVSAIGSGDLLLAGLMVALDGGAPIADALRFGVAAGTAGAARLEPDLDGRPEIELLAAGVELEFQITAPTSGPG